MAFTGKINASILSFLTVSGKKEIIIFMLRREVDDIAPKEIYWFPKRGKGGRADYLWEDKRVRQWLAIGTDEEIDTLWQGLINDHSISLFGDRVFELPAVRREKSESIHRIAGVRQCGRNQDLEEEYQCSEWGTDVSFLISEKANCAFLEGYKEDKTVKSMYPFGLLGEGTLSKCLERKVCAVFERRGMYWHLSGDRESVKDGSPEIYSGFIQADREFKKSHDVLVRNLDGTTVLGEAAIDEITGRWSMQLAEPAGRGQFLLRRKDSGEFVCGEKYYLISSISIKSDIIHTVITDVFGRKINIGAKQNAVPISKAVVWTASAAPDSIQAQIELNDKLVSVLSTMGKSITISDPYFFGDFVESNSQLEMNTSQRVFLNALVTTIASGNLEELQIVGHWAKAKKFMDGDKDTFLTRYRMVGAIINQTFKGTTHIQGLKKFEIVLSNGPFHDRYWFGNGIGYHVSNSVNGSFESKEFTIAPLDQQALMKLVATITKRIGDGESHKLAISQ